MTGRVQTRGNKEIADSQRHADQELSDLDRSQVTLAGRMETNRSGGIVQIHDGMHKGVEQDKDPDGRRTVTDTRPHGNHGTSVMVGLQERRSTTFQKDDGGINDFIIL